MGDDHSCNLEGIGIVRIKMDDGIVRELKEMRYVAQLKRNLISVGDLEALALWYLLRCCSQYDQRLNGGDKGHPPEQFLLLEG